MQSLSAMCAPATSVCLEDYRSPDKRYVVEIGTAAAGLPRIVRVLADSTTKPKGFCVCKRLGLLKGQKSLVAVYTDGCSLRLALAGKIYNLSDSQARAYRSGLFLFAKHFSLVLGSTTVLAFNYWLFERHDCWPEADIFAMVVRISQDEHSKQSFLRIWNEIAAGRDVTRAEFLRSLEA
jgi:hypothetical protein